MFCVVLPKQGGEESSVSLSQQRSRNKEERRVKVFCTCNASITLCSELRKTSDEVNRNRPCVECDT